MSIVGALLRTYFERQAARTRPGDWAERLQRSGSALAARFAHAADTPAHRDQLAHLIGIERWGQRRLRSALGEPPLDDEYDGYRPSVEATFAELAGAFAETRAATVALAHGLAQAGVAGRTVRHNQFGDMTAGAWLAYLDGHATREASRIR